MELHIRNPQYIRTASPESLDTYLAIISGLFGFYSLLFLPALPLLLPHYVWIGGAILASSSQFLRLLWPEHPSSFFITITRFAQFMLWTMLALTEQVSLLFIFYVSLSLGSCWSLTRD